MAGRWKAGGFLFPTSTGSYSVTGLGFEPQGVMFIYSNQATEDAVVTGSNLGAGMGIAGANYTGTGIVQFAMCFLPNQGQEHRPSCIVMESNGTTTDYRADMSTLDADGFTLNVTNAASADRPVRWLAWGEFANAGTFKRAAGSQTLTLGWRVLSLICFGVRSSAGDAMTTSATGWNYWNMGGGAYPAAGSTYGDFYGSWVHSLSAPSGQRSNERLTVDNTHNPTYVGRNGNASGPFLAIGAITAMPTGTGLNDLGVGVNTEDYDLFAFFDGEGDNGAVTPAASAAGTATVTLGNAAAGQPGAVIFAGFSDQPAGSHVGGADPAFMVGFATDNYQACVVTDADNTFFQSAQRSWVSAVGSGGVHAGTTEMTGTGFRLTTDDDDISRATMIYLAFGPPPSAPWVPQQWRRIAA